MSENVFETSSSESFTSLLCAGDSRTTEKIYRHPAHKILRDANLASGDPASSQTSWTDEKHSLYLNYIEDAFVNRLYDQGYYKHLGKRWQADRREISSVNTQNLTEEVESGFAESQSESEMPESHPDVANHSSSCRSKENLPSKQQDANGDTILGRTKKRKSENEFDGDIPRPQPAKRSADNESATSRYRERRQTAENRRVSDPSAKILNNRREDQVVPSMEDPPGREDVRL